MLISTLAATGLILLAPLAPSAAKDDSAPESRIAAATGSVPIAPESRSALARSDRQTALALPDGRSVTLVLSEAQPLGVGATIVAARMGAHGVETRPLAVDVVRRVGHVEGIAGSRALVILSRGEVIGGFIRAEGSTVWLARDPVTHGPIAFDARSADPRFLPVGTDFCHADEIAQPEYEVPQPTGLNDGIAGIPPCRELNLALDCDVEFTASLFEGNVNDAAAYALALAAAGSEIYTDDLNVRLRVTFLRLWEGSDPWNGGNTSAQLQQFYDYWEANETDVQRDLAHFLSGRGLGGGIAWLPGLCNGLGYAVSANLGGHFPYPLVDNNGQNWDIVVFTHELGHNVGAPHTHSYDPPLDGCGNGDCSQASDGTIMSYCHLCSGGMTNIALHFHPGNVETMLGYLDAVGCDYSSDAGAVVAMKDVLTAGAGETVTVDALTNDQLTNCGQISLVSFDAMTANGVEVTLVPPQGPAGNPSFSVAIPTDASGDDSFTYVIQDDLGATDTGTVQIGVMPLYPATFVIAAEPGLLTDYYQLPELTQLPDFSLLMPYATDVIAKINFPSTNGNFATSGLSDLVGAEFTGWVKATETGFYSFFTESDDGSRLFVDGQLVVDNDGTHGMVEASGVIGLQTGLHPIRIEFFEQFGGAGLVAKMDSPSGPKLVISQSLLSHGGTIVLSGDVNGDGDVNGIDIAYLLGNWGNPGIGDLDGDGLVGAPDLAVLLSHWTG